MSSQLGTSRATRTNKDKHAKSTVVSSQASQSPSSKTEKTTAKNQATVEQMRMALMIDSGKDTANIDTVKQLCEMTGRSEEDVVVALHDAQDDPDRAVAILMDGEQGQGEWEVQDKKKKRSTLKSDKENVGSPGQENDRGDQRSDRSRDRHDSDKHEGPPRRGRDRRNGGPPPRLANRGRGRERNNFRGDRDRDRGGFGGRNNYSDQNDRNTYNEVDAINGEEDWEAESLAINEFREQHSTKDFRDQKRGDRDRGFGGDRDRSFGGDRDRGFGGDRAYGDRDRSFGGDRDRGFGGDRDRDRGFGGDRDRDRGFGGDRGRGFGGNRGRGRGRGGFGRPNSRGGRSRRYDRNDSNEGPHIDTWTNETAENAEKENSGWGETWADSTEDWCEDQWTGSLEDTKVFTSSQKKTSVETDLTANITEPTNTIGQRLDVGSLFSKSAEFAKAPDFTKTGEPTSGDSFFASYNQQAAESIKNSIGIGSSSARQNLSNMPAAVPQSLGTLPAMPQRDMSHTHAQSSRSSVPSMMPQSTSGSSAPMHPSSTSSVSPVMLPAASATGPSAPVSTPPLAQPAQPQQRRQQRSKLPPPSKIPASAVEMPGHAMPQLDVQFGVEFGAESSQFGFAPSGSTGAAYSTSSAPNSSVTNHLGESNKSAADSSRQGSIMSSPPAGSQPSGSSMPSMEASPSRPSVFPDSVYSSPSKSESPANKAAEPTPFQSPGPDHKPSSLMASQRTSQSSSSMSQGSLSTSKPERDSSSMPNFSVANGYAANSYPTHSQSHKPSSSASPSQPYRQTGSVSQTSVASYPNQFPSQTQYSGASGAQQSQYASGQAQFPGSQGQFPSAGSGGSSAPAPSQYLPGQSQYPSGSQGSFPVAPVVTQGQYQAGGSQYHTNYQPSSVSFQSQPGVQPSQNPLYPNTTQQSGGSYPPGSGSFHVRDSQSSGNLQQSVVSLQQAAGSLQPSVVNLQQPAGNLPQSVGALASPAASQPSNSYQNQQPAPGLTKATTTQSTNAYNTQTYTGPPQPTTTQSPNAYSSQTYSSQHSSLHSQATTTQSPTSFNTQQAYSAQHSSQHGQATTTQSPSTYNTQTFSAQHTPQQNLQTSPLGNKLGDSLAKMSIKDSPSIESRTSQYDHTSNSTTTVSLTSSSSTTNASTISTSTSTVSATSTPVVTTSTLASRVTTSIPLTTKAPPNLPPGVPLMNPHLFMGQAAAASGLPPYFASLQGLQQPLYGYEELQMMQPARLPLQSNFYDLAYSGVPSTIAAGRDQAAALGTAPFTGAATDNKQMNRMEAQSPSQSTQQQSTHSAPQQTLPFNIHYSYFYPGAMLPGAAGFQYPTMFPMPPVTNTAATHVPGTTTAAQLPKTYGSHQGFPTKGTGTTADIGTGAYAKSHAQGFDKQGFPAGTPPPFSLPLANASQAGPLGNPAAPYGTPFLPMMPPQPHNQTLLHHPMPQDSGTGSNRGLQQPTNQGKPAAAKNNYYSTWN